MRQDEQRLLGKLEGRLEELHEDVLGLRNDVEALKQDLIKRTAFYKAVSYAVGIITTVVTLFVQWYKR